jgi:hypothetical protein
VSICSKKLSVATLKNVQKAQRGVVIVCMLAPSWCMAVKPAMPALVIHVSQAKIWREMWRKVGDKKKQQKARYRNGAATTRWNPAPEQILRR